MSTSRVVGMTFGRWAGLGPGVPGETLWRLLDYVPDTADECWANLAWQSAEETERLRRDPLLYDEPDIAHQPVRRSTAATSTRPRPVAVSATDDPLKRIPPRTYVEALTGETVPPSGMLRRPLPDHDDRTPSFQVLRSHWRCFGCGRGGSIIDLGAALYGLDPRGSGYREIRARLIADLEGALV